MMTASNHQDNLSRLFELLDELHQRSDALEIFKSFVHDFPGLLAIYDENYEGIAFSSDFVELLGFDEEQLQGDTWRRLVVNTDLDSTLDVVPVMKNRKVYGFENTWRTADGDLVRLSWRTSPWLAVGTGKEYTICHAHVVGGPNAY